MVEGQDLEVTVTFLLLAPMNLAARFPHRSVRPPGSAQRQVQTSCQRSPGEGIRAGKDPYIQGCFRHKIPIHNHAALEIAGQRAKPDAVADIVRRGFGLPDL